MGVAYVTYGKFLIVKEKSPGNRKGSYGVRIYVCLTFLV